MGCVGYARKGIKKSRIWVGVKVGQGIGWGRVVIGKSMVRVELAWIGLVRDFVG